MTDLHVFESGHGPDVVLLHGLPSPPHELEAVARELTGFRVLVPHLPGYGESPAAPTRHSVRAVSEALRAALRERGVKRPALVGYSMGAYRAIELASSVSARSVLALAGFASLSPEERAGMKGFADLLRAQTDVKPLLPPRYLSEAARNADSEQAVRAWADAATTETLIEELEDLAVAPSLLDTLAKLRCPLTARTGELDVAVPPSHARAMAAAAPQGVVEIVPGAGHALFLEDRAGTLDAIRRVASAA